MTNQERLAQKAKKLREWRAKDPDKNRTYQRNYYHANKDRVHTYPSYTRAYKRKFTVKKYGLSAEEYRILYEAQKGLCAICLRQETAINPSGELRDLNIDHSHETGEVRGLLCRNCNVALGLFNDSLDILAKATNYLSNAISTNHRSQKDK